MLNNIVDNLEQCGCTTLFNPVFIRPEQVVRFLLCISKRLRTKQNNRQENTEESKQNTKEIFWKY